MNYSRIYDNLIKKGVDRQLSKSTPGLYLERHHIIPKCMGGSNVENNLVYLTGAEHFVAHQLLAKIYPNNDKVIYAAHMMTIGADSKHKRTNKEYGWIREKFVTAMRELHKDIPKTKEHRHAMSMAKLGKSSGVNNNFYGKSHTDKYRKNVSEIQKIKQVGSGNNNARIWSIEFPDTSINRIVCLKSFAADMGISLYKLRNNKLPGYKIIDVVRKI